MDARKVMGIVFSGYDQKIMNLRFVQGNTQEETAEILGIHKKFISRIEKRCVNQLKARKKQKQPPTY